MATRPHTALAPRPQPLNSVFRALFLTGFLQLGGNAHSHPMLRQRLAQFRPFAALQKACIAPYPPMKCGGKRTHMHPDLHVTNPAFTQANINPINHLLNNITPLRLAFVQQLKREPWHHVLKLSLLFQSLTAISRKNIRAGFARLRKNPIHNSSCTAAAFAIIFQPMKQHKTPRIFAVLASVMAVASFIAGCTETVNTRGQVILPSRLAQIQPGTTTRQDVLQLLGSPSAQGTMNENRWYYVSSIVGTKAFDPHDLKSRQIVVIDFDPATDTVATLTQKNEADGKEINPLRETTPTHGQSMGIIDQLTGNLGGILNNK